MGVYRNVAVCKQKLIELQAGSGLSVADIAKKIGMSRSTVVAYFDDRINTPSMQNLEKMAQLFKVPTKLLTSPCGVCEHCDWAWKGACKIANYEHVKSKKPKPFKRKLPPVKTSSGARF